MTRKSLFHLLFTFRRQVGHRQRGRNPVGRGYQSFSKFAATFLSLALVLSFFTSMAPVALAGAFASLSQPITAQVSPAPVTDAGWAGIRLPAPLSFINAHAPTEATFPDWLNPGLYSLYLSSQAPPAAAPDSTPTQDGHAGPATSGLPEPSDITTTNLTMTINATTPAGTAGDRDVVTTNPDTQAGSLAGSFTYVAPPNPFIKLADPAVLPAHAGQDVAFSHDSTYMAVAHVNFPHITIYKRDGDTFTKLDNPATLPPNPAWGVAFSHDSAYLAVAHEQSPFIIIYKRDGDTFTKLSNPAVLPAGNGQGVAFSHDSAYLAVTHSASPFVSIYKRDGDTFTKLPDPAGLPTGWGYRVSFSHDSAYLAVTAR